MSQEIWSAVDAYMTGQLLPADPALEEAIKSSAAAGLPSIAVSPAQGKLLYLLARMIKARRILEIGTLGAYSTIWLARALPADGRMITLEYEARHATVARSNLARAGLSDKVEVIVGPALETLPQLESSDRGPFDLFFIDADKPATADYFAWSMKLSRPGSVIVVDNVVRKGAVTNTNSTDEDVQGVQRCLAMMAREPRIDATVIQSVGTKGYDGLAIGIVRE
jgi:predicted O-methyltransferase YrrM